MNKFTPNKTLLHRGLAIVLTDPVRIADCMQRGHRVAATHGRVICRSCSLRDYTDKAAAPVVAINAAARVEVKFASGKRQAQSFYRAIEAVDYARRVTARAGRALYGARTLTPLAEVSAIALESNGTRYARTMYHWEATA